MLNSSSIQWKRIVYRLVLLRSSKFFFLFFLTFVLIIPGFMHDKRRTPFFIPQVFNNVHSQPEKAVLAKTTQFANQVNVLGIVQKVITPSFVQSQSASSPSDSYLLALNTYRKEHGRNPLQWDATLAVFAQSRAESFNAHHALDNHEGFKSFLHNQDGFKKLGYFSVGENSSLDTNMEEAKLFSESYAKSSAHNENQLSADWTTVGIGISGNASDIIFAGHKM